MTVKGRRWLWTIGLVALVYLSSFAVLRYYVLPRYELNAITTRHPLRPIYATVYYPLRLLVANRWSFAPPDARAYVGKVDEVKQDKIVFDYGKRTLTVGFVCVPSACADLRRVKRGDEVEAVFGVALVSDRDTFINKLLLVRSCAPADEQCAATRQKQRLDDEEMERRIEASAKEMQICRAAMEQTLQRDNRYVPPAADSATIDQAVVERFNALEGTKRTCRDSVVDAHRRAVLESCTLHKCGDRIGGGCWHIADPIHLGVVSRAVEKCGT
jgi:hypothetical protein